jgi:hypothetical protein
VDKDKKPIKSFQDLDVYQSSYKAMLSVFKHILPKLPKEEEYDLKDQLRRSANELIDIYDKTSRQLYNLSLAWTKFGQRKERPNRETRDETSSATLAQTWPIILMG